ncbi:MAG: YqjF family protein [Candidatus Acidiferrales bacterium]
MEAPREEKESRFLSRRVFLSAEWRNLVMLNYEVDPDILRRRVPRGTEVDSFRGKTFVSLVGFQFLRTKLFGFLPVPFHADFEEVNLRFYVRRREGNEVRRGVVFIREIVPKRGVARIARLIYGENYICCPMRHVISANGVRRTAEYQWKLKSNWCTLHAEGAGDAAIPKEESLEQFITEHYCGYVSREGGCLEYRVSHEPWRVWKCTTGSFEGNSDMLYGPELGSVLRRTPSSAFIADGSSVLVFTGKRIR